MSLDLDAVILTSRFGALVLGLATAAAITAGSGVPAPAFPSSRPASAKCRVKVSRIVSGYGAPDDLLSYRGHILFGDIHAGIIASIVKGRTTVLARHLSTPEGLVSPATGHLIVVEQGKNQLTSIDLAKGKRKRVLSLKNTTGQEGVDGITLSGHDIIIPNSPYGTILRLHKGRLTEIASGLGRPTDAIAYGGGLAVADENADAVWLVKHGGYKRLAALRTPDDVTVAGNRLLAVTLGDGSLWEIKPHLRRLTNRFSQPQGLVTLGSASVAVADSRQNAIFRVTLSKGCH